MYIQQNKNSLLSQNSVSDDEKRALLTAHRPQT